MTAQEELAMHAKRWREERDEARAALAQHRQTMNELIVSEAVMRKAIGVMVPTIIRCFIQCCEDRPKSAGRDVDIDGATKTLARVEAAMAQPSPAAEAMLRVVETGRAFQAAHAAVLSALLRGNSDREMETQQQALKAFFVAVAAVDAALKGGGK